MTDPGQAESTRVEVVLADDHGMVRAGLRMVLEAGGARVVGEAHTVDAALGEVQTLRPRVAVLDLHMPGTDTIAAIPAFLAAAPETAIVVLTMDDEPRLARAAIAAGARGYVLKDAADEELVEAVRAAAGGSTYLTPRLAQREDEEPQPGATFAGHRIDALVARGGMAVVYRATDLALQRPVALKLIAPTLSADPVFRARFERECRLAAAIDHPHVVPVHHAGEERGWLYVTMRYVEGTDLLSLLESERRLSPPRAVTLTAQVAGGLEAAHELGLVHRDVKPGNILVGRRDGREHAYLTDFGVGVDRAHATHLTATGFTVGTAEYMAPEQATGGDAAPPADVYALGCVLFRALTGRVPFERSSAVDTLWAHAHEPPPRARELAPDLPPALDEVLARALAKRPEDRQPSAAAFARDALAAVAALR